MTYFSKITTLNVLKAKYRELCKIHHPDLGGSTEVMQAINAEYSEALQRVHDHKGENLSPDDINIEKDLMQAVNKIVALQGIIIEITGRWIWVTGETKQYKDYFKEIGFWWARKKEAWYWRPADEKKRRHRPVPLDRIRARYGSINIGTVEREGIA